MNLISSVDIPNNWEELVALKNVLPVCTPEVARLPDDLNFYQTYTKLVPLEIRLEIVNRLIGNNNIALVKNNFPYTRLLQNLPKVKQYCLWSRTMELSTGQIESQIKKIFPNQNYFWFENSNAVKSIPEIWHCHVFIKEN
jgi:hypothetical protein